MKKILLVLFLLTSLTVNAKGYKFPKNSEPHAIIEMGYGSVKEEAEPTLLYEIDGIDVGKRKNNVQLTPGNHTLKCKSAFDLKGLSYKVPEAKDFENTKENNTIEVQLKAGKTYYLGFSTKSADIKDWKPTIFKIKDKILKIV